MVSFAPVHADPKRTTFRKTVDALGHSCIFIRSTNDDDWYQEGVAHLGCERPEIAKNLLALIERVPHKKVCFLGTSMGGYAALLYALDCRPDGVLALSPQLRPPVLKRPVKTVSLISQYRQVERSYPVEIHVCKRHEDFLNAKRFAKVHSSTNVVGHDCNQHSVGRWLKVKEKLIPAISAAIDRLMHPKR
jgi:alpha-beta hydrolase superfamily lysophospholipase